MAKKKNKKRKTSARPSRLKRIEQNIGSLFTILTRLLLLSLVLSACFLIYKSLGNDDYIIQSFQVPKKFEDNGNSGLVISRKVQDKVKEVKESIASTKTDEQEFQADFKPDLEVDVIGFGLSLNSLTYHLKSLLGRKNYTITGELTDVDHRMDLTMRMTGFESKTFTKQYESDQAIAIDELMEEAAKFIIKNTDPYRIAIYHYNKKEYGQSLKIITKMIKEDREAHWAYLAWGSLLNKQGKRKEAIKKLQQALAIQPNFNRIYINIGWLHFNERNFDYAIEAFEKGLAANPKCIPCLNGIAMSHRLSDREEEAIEAYDLAIRTAPDMLWVYGNKADYLLSKKDTLGAIALFDLAKKKAKDGPDKYLAIAGNYLTLGQLDSALIYAVKILEIEPENSFVLYQVVNIHFGQKNNKKALAYLPNIRNINEHGNGDHRWHKQNGLNLLAMCSYREKKYEDALTIIKESIEIDKNQAAPYTTLAETYGFMGQMDDFYNALEMALQKGFPLEELLKDEPYVRFIKQSRFQKIIQTFQEKKKEKELAQAVKG